VAAKAPGGRPQGCGQKRPSLRGIHPYFAGRPRCRPSACARRIPATTRSRIRSRWNSTIAARTCLRPPRVSTCG